jgi:hypothetical protein
VLLPLWGSAGPGIAVSSAGDYRGPAGVADHLVYVVETKDGQMTLSPADFKSQYGWVNESWQVGLYKPGAEKLERIYVNAASEGPYDGKTWATAFSDLQDALSIAQANAEVWVAAGVYTPDRGTGARTASFHMKNGVRLLGGFAGTETSSYQRDPNKNETILSGDLKGDDRPNFTNYDDNSYHILLAHNTDSSDTVLDGFVITGGNANGPVPKRGENTNHHGGGLIIRECSLTLTRCIFRYNSAIQYGGGMCSIYGRPILENCTFTANKASLGGAIFSNGSKGSIFRCKFTKNSAYNHGGGVNLTEDSSMFIDCTFSGNSGTLYLEGGASFGGGLCIAGPGNVILTNCRFLENSADKGGGVSSSGCSVQFSNCLFNNNLATHWGGGIYNIEYVDDVGNRVLLNCTIVRNKSRAHGCGIYSEPNCSPVLANCIVWGNTDGNEISESEQIYGGTRSIRHCCIQAWSGKLGGVGNFGNNPLFIDPNGPDGKIGTEDDDFRLSSDSPCINAGDNSTFPADASDLDGDGDTDELIPFDIEGKARVLNGTIDIGAYEGG